MIQFLDFNNNKPLQYHAAWALTNITSGTDEEAEVVVRCGAIPKFVKLITSTSKKVKSQAMYVALVFGMFMLYHIDTM